MKNDHGKRSEYNTSEIKNMIDEYFNHILVELIKMGGLSKKYIYDILNNEKESINKLVKESFTNLEKAIG